MASEEITQLRRQIEEELETARQGYDNALSGDGPAVFSWHGEQFWIDRVRRTILPIDEDFHWRSATTLPADDDGPESARETLEFFDSWPIHEHTGAILLLWAWLVRGTEMKHAWEIIGTSFLNMGVAQPAINPAF